MGDLLGTSSAAFESNFGSLRTDKDAMADGLRKVALASGDQSMRAFGPDRIKILETMNKIRSQQKEVFAKQFKVESRLPTYDTGGDTEEQNYADIFSESFQSHFDRQEEHLLMIRQKLEGLTDCIKDVNTQCACKEGFPVNPGMSEQEPVKGQSSTASFN